MDLLGDMLRYDGQALGLTDRASSHFGFFDEFWRNNDEDYAIVADTTVFQVSATSGYQAGGMVEIGTGATNNDEIYVLANKSFLPAAGKPFYVGCRMALVEAATNAANFCFGFSSVGAANTLIDDGGGPVVNADKMLLYKTDGSMYFNAVTAKATGTGTNVQTTAQALAFASATFYELGVYFQPPRVGQTNGTVRYFVNKVEVATHPVTTGTATTGTTAQPTAALSPIFGVKAGTAAAQSMFVDWLCAYGKR
jgi:hypothetical protein